MAFLHLFIVSGWVFISSVIKGLVFVCFLMLFLVGLASVGIDFYFVLNSFFLRAKGANWNGEGLTCVFFSTRGVSVPGSSSRNLGTSGRFWFRELGKRNETWEL